MSQTPDIGSLTGVWTYRSFNNDPNLATEYANYLFGSGYITIEDAPMGVLRGTLGDTGWSLKLSGSINYGYPYVVRFQGKGIVSGEEWIYDYLGFVVPAWPNGVNQVPAIVGTIVRTIPHSGSAPTTVAPAGVSASWIAVWKPSYRGYRGDRRRSGWSRDCAFAPTIGAVLGYRAGASSATGVGAPARHSRRAAGHCLKALASGRHFAPIIIPKRSGPAPPGALGTPTRMSFCSPRAAPAGIWTVPVSTRCSSTPRAAPASSLRRPPARADFTVDATGRAASYAVSQGARRIADDHLIGVGRIVERSTRSLHDDRGARVRLDVHGAATTAIALCKPG